MKATASAKQLALNYLKIRDRSEFEIKNKLIKKGCSLDEIGETISWLKEKKFLNDFKLAENYLSSCQKGFKKGKLKIAFDMTKKGIKKDIVTEIMARVDAQGEEERAKLAADKWLENNKKDNKYQRLGHYLTSRGYETSVIVSILKKVFK